VAGPRKFTDANLEGVSTFLSTSLLHDENNTVNSLCDSLEKLVLYSKSKSTWTKHMTAWNLVEQFFRHSNNKFTNVLDIKQARAFVVWALEKRGLKPSTVKSYLYSIKLAHCLSGKEHVDFAKDTVIQMALKGADNLYELEMQNNKIRLAMDISTLKILGHRIAKSDWTKLSSCGQHALLVFSLRVGWVNYLRTLKNHSTRPRPWHGDMLVVQTVAEKQFSCLTQKLQV